MARRCGRASRRSRRWLGMAVLRAHIIWGQREMKRMWWSPNGIEEMQSDPGVLLEGWDSDG
jgi:hypothetical protein